MALQVRDSLDLIITDTQNLLKALEKRAFEFKDTLMVGRSHGIHGEPITFGLVLAVWFDEIKHALILLENAKECISYGKLSGAMGNFAHAPLEFEEKVCQNLGLKPAPVSNQIIQRDRYAQVISALAILAASCEKIAVNIRHYNAQKCMRRRNFSHKGKRAVRRCHTSETPF